MVDTTPSQQGRDGRRRCCVGLFAVWYGMATVYLETTIPSYLTAWPSRDLIVAAHQRLTREWWDTRHDRFELYVSQFVLDEAGGGDELAAAQRLQVLVALPLLDINEDVTDLAVALLAAGAVSGAAALDAAHIAVAAVHAMDFLLTWNCRHIANAESIPAVRRVCTELGYECPTICTPEELMGND